jgi:hypothetical protein
MQMIAAMLGDVVALGGTVAAPQHLAYVPQQVPQYYYL